MTGVRDLARLYPALSTTERSVLMLRAWKEGRGEDPQIRATIPNDQTDDFNSLMALLRGATGDLTDYIVIMVLLVEQLSLRWCWLTTLEMAAKAAVDLAETAVSAMPTKRERAALRRELTPGMARFAISLSRDLRGVNAQEVEPTSSDAIAAGLIVGMREIWPQRWRELRAAEIVSDEVAQEFDGEDPLRPAVRGLLDTCRADLLTLKDRIEPHTGALAREEPDNAMLDPLRDVVRGCPER